MLVTGITDEASLALPIALAAQRAGAVLVCAGLGPTSHHRGLSDAASRYLREARAGHVAAVRDALGPHVPSVVLDASLDASVQEACEALAQAGPIDGLVHAIAMDRTIRAGRAKPLLEVTREEFLDCMSVSTYSLLALVQGLLRAGGLAPGASIVALSYLGAERVMFHPYRNVGVAKAALERLVRELAAELGRAHGVRVTAVRFSPWAASRAGGAIPGLDAAAQRCGELAPLGNAGPEALAAEVVHLLRPGGASTGEVRHVDGGYHVLG